MADASNALQVARELEAVLSDPATDPVTAAICGRPRLAEAIEAGLLADERWARLRAAVKNPSPDRPCGMPEEVWRFYAQGNMDVLAWDAAVRIVAPELFPESEPHHDLYRMWAWKRGGQVIAAKLLEEAKAMARAAGASTDAELTGDDATGESNPRPKASVNARMLETIQKNPEAMGWTTTQWAKHLHCAKSTVADTKTWKDLAMGRDRARAERATDRRQRRRPRSRGK